MLTEEGSLQEGIMVLKILCLLAALSMTASAADAGPVKASIYGESGDISCPVDTFSTGRMTGRYHNERGLHFCLYHYEKGIRITNEAIAREEEPTYRAEIWGSFADNLGPQWRQGAVFWNVPIWVETRPDGMDLGQWQICSSNTNFFARTSLEGDIEIQSQVFWFGPGGCQVTRSETSSEILSRDGSVSGGNRLLVPNGK